MEFPRIEMYDVSIMELRHLRYFVGVAGELHFGRAAETLGISQPPLSQQIRQLEAELGVALFERTSRRVRLTEAGRLFLAEAKATLERADHAVSTARRAAEGEIGALSIGLSPSSVFVPEVTDTIAAFRRRFPDVHLELAERSFAAQHEALAQGTLDIGLLRRGRVPQLPPGIAAEPIVEDRMIVALPAHHPLAASDAPIPLAALAGEPMVHYPYDRDGFLEDLWRAFERAGLRPVIVQETHEVSTLLGLVAAGLGISVVAGSLRRLVPDDLRYRPVADEAATSRLWLLHDAARGRPAARRFVALLGERLATPLPSAPAAA